MGSASSFSYWTEDEVRQNKNTLELQSYAKDWIIEYMYYGIPVRSGKASHDPRSALFIETDPKVVKDAFLGKGDIELSTLETVPSAVSINKLGIITITFNTKIPFEYKGMTTKDIEGARKFDIPDAIAIASDPIYVPNPDPPILIKAEQTSLQLSMLLPQPPGISQQLELQYAIITPQIYRKAKEYLELYNELLDKGINVRQLMIDKPENRDVYREVDTDLFGLGICPFQFTSLSTRPYYKTNFMGFTLDRLQPGDCFCFRVKYMNHRAWSHFSHPSIIMATLPAPPSQPDSPIVGFVSATSVQLFWVPPMRDNGSPIKEYRLQGKSAGGEYVEIFRGKSTSFLATDLHPEFIYSFELCAVNSPGASKWSVSTSVTTPSSLDKPKPRDPDSFEWLMALEFRDAWRELWDPKTEMTFYFNTITGTRQLQIPDALQADIDGEQYHSVKASSSKDKGRRIENKADENRREETEFRKKRYRLLHSLHNPTEKKRNDKNTEFKNIEIRRTNLLLDGFRKINTMAPVDMNKRLKCSFTGEPGIDSGGVGKEFFLLLSRQACIYASDMYRGLLFVPDEKTGTLFFSDETRLPVQKTIKNENQGTEDNNNNNNNNTDTNVYNKSLPDQTVEDMMNIKAPQFCKFLGRLAAKALFDRQLIDFPLSTLLLKHMLGLNLHARIARSKENEQSIDKERDEKNNKADNKADNKAEENGDGDDKINVSTMLAEVQDLDSELYSSLQWIANNNITNIIYEKFSVSVIERKVDPISKIGITSIREISLCANGENRDVTEENKEEYIKYLVEWKTHFAVSSYLQPFLSGFHELIPLQILQDYEIMPNELNLLLCGKPIVDVDELRAYCIYQGIKEGNSWGEDNEIIVWLWQALRDVTQGEVRAILSFFTGSSRVPLDGYDPPLNITQGSDMDENSLPRTHTCFNQLVLPTFTSYNLLKEKLLFAAKESEGFTLA
jgi:hypothetical protein